MNKVRTLTAAVGVALALAGAVAAVAARLQVDLRPTATADRQHPLAGHARLRGSTPR